MTTLAKFAVATAAALAVITVLALVGFNQGRSHRAAATDGVDEEVASYVSSAGHLNVHASCHRVAGRERNGADAASVRRQRLRDTAYSCVFSGADWEAATIGFGNCFLRSPAGHIAAAASGSCSHSGRSSRTTEIVAGRRWQILGHDSAVGRNAAAISAAADFDVLTLALQASARPRLPVHVSWNLTCISLAGPQTASGRFTTRNAKPRIIGDTNGSSCSITATARLAGKGRLELRILGGD